MRGVVVGDDDDGALGVRGSDRGDDVRGAPLGEQVAKPALARGQVVEPGPERCQAEGCRTEAPAPQGEHPRRDPGGGREPQRPPEGVVNGLLVDDRLSAVLAQLGNEPLGRRALARGAGLALEGAELVEELAVIGHEDRADYPPRSNDSGSRGRGSTICPCLRVEPSPFCGFAESGSESTTPGSSSSSWRSSGCRPSTRTCCRPTGTTRPTLLSVISAFAFFASIVLHELGHAFVAMRRGIGITDITLWMFGGVARMDRDSDSPRTEFEVAVAGPAVTAAIVVACVAVGVGLGGAHDFWQAVKLQSGTDVSGPLAALAWLGKFNLFILFFNLIPAFPLDGGRIARAIAWKISGDRSRATRTAANLGQWFSYGFIGLGLFLVVKGDAFDGIWLALIGWILGQSARGAIAQTEIAKRIEGITVADVMDTDPVAIPDDASVERALDEYFLRYRWPWFFVVDAAERFRGLLDRDAADAVPEVSRTSSSVAEVVEAGSDKALQVSAEAPLETLLGNEALRRVGALAAVDSEGRLRGVITAEQVGRALRTAVTGQA